MRVKYLHTMVRVKDLDKCIAFFELIGLEIIWGMEQKNDKWASGEIMDPENGKIYGCSMWLDKEDPDGNTLKVRGWLAFLYRTQTWYRVK